MSRVYVGMSGGVDSSVTAALLKAEGHEVIGVYMKNWTQDLPGMKCPWAEDLADAKRVAVQLGIDFKVFDFQEEYRQKVVDYMIREYQAGRTPNPDIMCNQEIKFKLFLETALEDGAELIATGHYARVRRMHEQPAVHASLLMGLDQNKDQTYFLYRVTEEALAHTLFPVGELTKPEVRAKAAAFGLVTAAKKDSQGICFVGEIGIKEFLQQYVAGEPGQIIDKKTGQHIGQHEGAIFYTLGQRHGLGVGGGLPYYVVGKDMAKNVVYVTTDLNDETLWRSTLTLRQLHWINEPPQENLAYQVRTRYRAKLIECRVHFEDDDRLTLDLKDPERAITPGQSAVLYLGETVIGGGIVE
ncbi:MAG TPA: tRNA 2-thiouridine(34) synthase MnmA [Candidatus Saccharimonadales bacterium]|nr:tRNA 2-thiouridine(34) synthase MnmA [Candidatus Saccharimonadales bacterium]